jgi:[acyl-carrier-protein] S-malonyltransferase
VFDLASDVVGYDVAAICFESPQEDLNKTIYCQICTLAVELAIYEIFKLKTFKLIWFLDFHWANMRLW